jgi:intergrase/recombinase
MGELGVQDRYIDAFCGRVSKSVLARHYTDYSSERLALKHKRNISLRKKREL